MTKFIFVTGGVLSSLGKGIAAASIAALLQAHGLRTRIRKLDPYINLDPGTMSPYQHGEVFVTEDGAETDLDLGHYERFTGVQAKATDNITAGRIYFDVITKERRGDYLGGTVQVIPHITDEIKAFITRDCEDLDVLICEIGGTVGDIEGLPFIEAIRQLRNDVGRENCLFIHLTLLPFIASAQELKTKPSQHSVKELLSLGIQPDFLLCRTQDAMPESTREKLALFCNVPKRRVIDAIDVGNIYEVPLKYHAQGLDKEILQYFHLQEAQSITLTAWQDIVQRTLHAQQTVKIGLIAKYADLPDAYKSLLEALSHAGLPFHAKVTFVWVDAEQLEGEEALLQQLDMLSAILVPGGFGERGVEGKIRAIAYARQNNIPCMGICLGMQLMVIEYARHVLGLKGAGSTEMGSPQHPVVALMREWVTDAGVEKRSEQDDLGGTMRLGSYPTHLKPGSKIANIYGETVIHERHRHRYEVNATYVAQFEEAGFLFSGMSPDGALPEIVELPTHPWFIGVQYHPEFKSRPFAPHPFFVSFIEAAMTHQGLLDKTREQDA